MRENKTHMTAKEQIDAVIARVHELNGRRDAVYARLMEKLEEQGVRLVDFRKSAGRRANGWNAISTRKSRR